MNADLNSKTTEELRQMKATALRNIQSLQEGTESLHRNLSMVPPELGDSHRELAEFSTGMAMSFGLRGIQEEQARIREIDAVLRIRSPLGENRWYLILALGSFVVIMLAMCTSHPGP